MKAFLMVGESWMGEAPVYGVITADSSDKAVQAFKKATGIRKFEVAPSGKDIIVPVSELRKSKIPSIVDARYMQGRRVAYIHLKETTLIKFRVKGPKVS